ncbi:MAG: glycosyltransferase family 2 protein [bacterium]|nr:glycosyltransferase family 2 protein [bacterium]
MPSEAQPNISAVILTHNSEASVTSCIESVLWCDEICIIDDNSTDRTLQIAADLGAKIFRKKMQGNFAAQRNYGLTLVNTPWVLFIDSDEVASKPLEKMLRKAISEQRHVAYRIPRVTMQHGERLSFGEYFGFSLVRFGKKDAGKWEGKVHEIWQIRGRIGAVSAPIFHYQKSGIDGMLKKINYYSSIRASELYDQKVKPSYVSIIFLPIGKFIINYIVKLGVFDGMPGLMNAIAMSFYTFLVRAKLWLLWHESTKIVRN